MSKVKGLDYWLLCDVSSSSHVQNESEMCGHIVRMSSTYQNKKSSSYKDGSANASFSEEYYHLGYNAV
jgi:hypothetical protein